uniref:Putative conserved secreted protein n=1 Tax=Rhipicephalus microplus TaxID=6941 RepID=A0A6G5A327_RHIMP
MKTMELFSLFCTMILVFSAFSASKKTLTDSKLCKQTAVCEHQWEILCRSAGGHWLLTCGENRVVCRSYWRSTCARPSVRFANQVGYIACVVVQEQPACRRTYDLKKKTGGTSLCIIIDMSKHLQNATQIRVMEN